MNRAKMLAPIGLLVLALVVYASTFVVNQWETAIRLRLGEIVHSDYEPGLHFMIPVINSITKFDKRIQTLDSRPQRFLTIEKKDVIVDSYAKWRIATRPSSTAPPAATPNGRSGCSPSVSTPACATSSASGRSKRWSPRTAKS